MILKFWVTIEQISLWGNIYKMYISYSVLFIFFLIFQIPGKNIGISKTFMLIIISISKTFKFYEK